MKKTAAYILLGVALVVGVALGYGGRTLLGSPGAGEVRNASLRVGDEAPGFRLADHTGAYVQLSD